METGLTVIIFFDEFSQVLLELCHPVRGYEYLKICTYELAG
jgi:hypothetical protein